MSFRFNPLTGKLDLVGASSEAVSYTPPFTETRRVLGKLSDLDENYYNLIDCCSLPITTTRQTIDLGTIDDLCN